MKKISDIKTELNETVRLGKKSRGKKQPPKKNKFPLNKIKSPIQKVNDIKSDDKNFIYIKGKKFTPPRYLGNLIKIAGIGFIILLIINTLNVYFIGKKMEQNLSDTAYQGYNFLLDAGKSATKIQFDKALESFESARENFEIAEKEMWFITRDNSFYGQQNNIGYAINALLESGEHFATAGKHFLDALEEFNKIPLFFVAKNDDKPDQDEPSLTDTLKTGLQTTDLAFNQINLANEKIGQINEISLPRELKSRITFAKQNITDITEVINEMKTHFPAILKLLGDRYPHRYLILLQNNNEIRPTGGFIGSYAIIDLNDGYIERLTTHDVYDIDGSYGHIIEPPEEFKTFTSNWRFRDSNYSPDFPVSAKKARWFLEKEGGPTVDTVIAINQGLLDEMLKITGPVQVGNFGTLDSENYNLLLSYVIEGKIWGPEDPKHILKVFIPAFKEAILKEENLSRVMSKLYKAAQQKHIIAYSSDDDIQALFDAIGISGRVHETQELEDYLSVINISTGGTKSEQYIEETINHHTSIDENGQIINELTISRAHTWTDDIYLRWREILRSYGFTEMPDSLIDILGRGENKVSVRIYVPLDSQLLESDAPDLMTKYDSDLKKTYFFTQLNVKPGEKQSVTIKYRLPFNLNFQVADTYKLIVDKQPGSRGSIFNKTLTADIDLDLQGVYPSELYEDTSNTIRYSTNLVYDRYFSAVYSK